MKSESQIQKCKKIVQDEMAGVFRNTDAAFDEIIERMLRIAFGLQVEGGEMVDEFFEKSKNIYPEISEYLNGNKRLELKALIKDNHDYPALSYEDNFRIGVRLGIETMKN